MRPSSTELNLFAVDTPHQLLNAVEAIHSLQLRNNHLLVTRPKNGAHDKFTPLIKADDWVTVSFRSLRIKPRHRVQKLLGSSANRWYCRCLHFLQMLALAKVAARFRHVDRLFLGHYSVEWTPFMRHMANTIKYNTLYLLDDGTDTIEINKKRHGSERKEREAPIETSASQKYAWRTIESHLRTKYWTWKLAEARYVTFFTIYNLDLRKGDRLIRNNYSYLQSVASLQPTYLPDTVIFIGLCSADNYIEMNVHLEFLVKVRDHFTGKRITYVAHPRDSASCVMQVRERLQCDLWQSSSVIEYDLMVRGIKPKVVAGFVSSALITLAHLMGAEVEVVCFYIAPEHWVHWGEDALGAYNYMKSNVEQRVTIVPLCLWESECKPRSPSIELLQFRSEASCESSGVRESLDR
jgi:hypothetical protein